MQQRSNVNFKMIRSQFEKWGGKWLSVYAQNGPYCTLITKLAAQKGLANVFNIGNFLKNKKFITACTLYSNVQGEYIAKKSNEYLESKEMSEISMAICKIYQLKQKTDNAISQGITNPMIQISDIRIFELLTGNQNLHLFFKSCDQKTLVNSEELENILNELIELYEEKYGNVFYTFIKDFYNTTEHEKIAKNFITNYKINCSNRYKLTPRAINKIICDNLPCAPSAFTINIYDRRLLDVQLVNGRLELSILQMNADAWHSINIVVTNADDKLCFTICDPNMGAVAFSNIINFKQALLYMLQSYAKQFKSPELITEVLELPASHKLQIVTPEIVSNTSWKTAINIQKNGFFTTPYSTPVWFLKVHDFLIDFVQEEDSWKKYKIIFMLRDIYEQYQIEIEKAIENKIVDQDQVINLQNRLKGFLEKEISAIKEQKVEATIYKNP